MHRPVGRPIADDRPRQLLVGVLAGRAVRPEFGVGGHGQVALGASGGAHQAGIEEGNATVETRVPGWAAFTAPRLPGHRFVATTAGQVAGWVAASPVSGRCVYAGVAQPWPPPAARASAAGSCRPWSPRPRHGRCPVALMQPYPAIPLSL